MNDVRLSLILDLRRQIVVLQARIEELEEENEYQRLVIERHQSEVNDARY